ncbi:hypothetical protein Tco_0451725 [Tanacetum coccineum]
MKFMNSSLTDAKSRSVDGGFVASVVGGGVGVDNSGGGVNDYNDCEMTVEITGEDSDITETASVVGISEKFKNLVAKLDEREKLETGTSAFCGIVESVT